MEKIKLSIPEGCKTVIVKVDGENITTEFEPKNEEKFEPKDGDIVTDKNDGTVVIYAETNKTGGIVSYAGVGRTGHLTITKKNGWGFTKGFLPATEEEKQELFDVLAKSGYCWNAEKKKLEELPRWRADINGRYYIVNEYGYPEPYFDERKTVNDNHNEYGNYFRTEKAAERVASQIREIFKNCKAE